MIRLAASTSPVEVAFAAFDTAAIELHRMYGGQDGTGVLEPDRGLRMDKAMEVVRLWDEFQALFLTEGPEDAA